MTACGTSRRFVATHNSVAIEGIADIRRSRAARRSDANDPNRTLGAAFCCDARPPPQLDLLCLAVPGLG